MDTSPLSIIEAKRDGRRIGTEAMRAFVHGVAQGTVPDYQTAAFLMAGFLNGFDEAETVALTEAMLTSGGTIDLSGLTGAKVGKHSTGGVGDKVSLVAVPLAAALGLVVPKLSGRGLGHTGGTLDKLEAIPGLRTDLDIDAFMRVVAEAGCCIAGQTEKIAPADRTLYALRGVTGTTASIPLIAASIMSKKLAEGIDALVLDVKCGRGAFMRTQAEAEELARLMEAIGARMGVRTSALISPMDEPLGTHVGNALEVEEAVRLLRGETAGRQDLLEACLAVTARMLVLGGKAVDDAEGAAKAQCALEDGSGLKTFRKMVAAQGGDARVADDPVAVLPQARCAREVAAQPDALAVGRACVALGAGRRTKGEAIDPAAGMVRKPGAVWELRCNDEERMNDALRELG